jgi:hypothetical protein
MHEMTPLYLCRLVFYLAIGLDLIAANDMAELDVRIHEEKMRALANEPPRNH